MRILITGANGFIGKNLQLYLSEKPNIQVEICLRDDLARIEEMLNGVDIVFHLAGINRSKDIVDFQSGNAEFTLYLASLISKEYKKSGKPIKLVFVSSIQADLDNPYGKSKLKAEQTLLNLAEESGLSVYIYRLPNIFGKWCRPNYNSVVATFCHNISRGLPIEVHNPNATLTLVYIDDVLEAFMRIVSGEFPAPNSNKFLNVNPQYQITVGDLAKQLQIFFDSRLSLNIDSVGSGLIRALYSTYVSYMSIDTFVYNLPQYNDSRGIFVEMLKTYDAGQFSYFTAYPGATRGGHYHHTKTEKFLVVKGEALFKFRHMWTGEIHELQTSEKIPQIVESIPGWTHDITNIGQQDMIVMLWANEIFNKNHSDTFKCPV